MKGGFLLGSIALIGIYVIVQPGASGRTEQASNVLVQLARRLLSPGVAGIGNHAGGTRTEGKLAPIATGGSGSGSKNIPV